MKKIKNLLVELLAAFVFVSTVVVTNTKPVLADSVFDVSGIEETYQFTGEAITPEPVVKFGDAVLTKGEDYTVAYSNNIDVSTGQATVTIAGIEGTTYAELSEVKHFDITGKVDLSSCKLYVYFDGDQNTNFEWTGSEIKPVITLEFVNINGKVIEIDNTNEKNYTVTYTNNVKVDNGAAVATVTAKSTGSYTGSKDFNFYIQRKVAEIDETQLVALSETLTYDGNNRQLITSPLVLKEEDSCAKVSYAFGTSETSGPKGDVYYSDYRNVLGKNAGTYYIYAHIEPQDMDCGYAPQNIYIGSVEIEKAKYDVTTPIVNSSLTYNGLDRVLTNLDKVQGVGVRLNDIEARSQSAATTRVPVIEYAFGEDDTTVPVENWSSSPLKKKNAGTYYVWYRVVALDDNHLSETAKPLTITIKKHTPTILLSDNLTAVYDGSPKDVGAASVILVNDEQYSETSHGEITYSYYLNPTCSESSKVTEHKDAATYYVVATLNALPESNYNTASSEPATLRISKANSQILTAPTSEGLDEFGFYNFDYTGSNISLIIPGTQTGGNFNYAVTKESVSTAPADDSEKWDENIPVGKNVGDYKVWYRVKGDENHYSTAISSLTVHINKAEVAVPTVGNIVFDGEHHNSGITNSEDKLYTVDTANDDKGGTNKGTYKVTLKLKDTANYIWRGDTDYKAYNTGATKNPNKEIEYNITALNISTGTITISDRPEYTGDYVTPSVTKVEVNGLEIDPSGYDVTYEKNLHASEGRSDDENYQPVVTVTAKANSNYTGSCSLPFTINRKSIANTTITFTNGQTYVWENTGIEPAIVVKDGNTTLTKDLDYTVSYSNNTNVTTAQSKAVVTITGIGDYKDSNSENFEITQLHLNSPGVTITCDTTSGYVYTGYEIKPTVTISYKKGTGTGSLVEGTDFEVIYGNNIDVTSATSKGTIKIVLSEDKNKNVSGTDNSRTFNIIPKNLQNNLSSTNITIDTSATTTPCVWNGQEQRPTVYVSDLTRNRNNVDETHLVLDKDFTVSYLYNVDAGTAYAIATGKGNYVGTISKQFTINQYDISTQYDIKYDSSDKVYTGSAIEPAIVVKYNNQNSTLSEDDYEVSYESNVNVGRAKITVNITNPNCPGVKYVYFNIVKRDLTTKAVFNTTNNTLSFPWCGQNIEPIFTIKDDLGNVLEPNVDYTLSDYTNHKDIGEYTVTATFANNYEGSKDVKYTIRALTLDDVRVYEWENKGSQTGAVVSRPELRLSSSTYNGKPQRKDVEIQYQNQVSTASGKVVYSNYVDVNTLTNDTYKVSYTDDVDAGTANVKIKMDSVEDTKPAHFDISAKDDINLTFTIDPKSITDAVNITRVDGLNYYVWKNEPYTPAITVTDKVIVDSTTSEAKVLLQGTNEENHKDFLVEYSDNTHAGTATITLTGKGNYKDKTTTTFEIKQLTHDHLSFNYTLSAGDSGTFNYDTHTVVPKLTYIDGIGNNGGELSSSFYEYVFNENTAASNTAQIKITLKDPKNDTNKAQKTYTFTINKKVLTDLDSVTFTTKNDTKTFPWCGKEIIPTFVIYDGTHELRANTDYTLSPCDEDGDPYAGAHIEPDTYYYKATFTGNYDGYKILDYTIRKLTLDQDIKIVEWIDRDGHNSVDITNKVLSSSTYNGTNITKDVELQYKNTVSKDSTGLLSYDNYVPLTGDDGFTPSYSNNKNASSASNPASLTLTIKNSTTHLDISEKSTVNLTFTINSKPLKNAVTITRKDANTIPEYAYRGSAYTPAIIVTDKSIVDGDNKYELTTNDYSVSYSDNTYPGTATIKITGKGNYTGSETTTFVIHELGHDDLDFSYEPTTIYFDYGTHPIEPILTYKANTGNGGVQLANPNNSVYTVNWTNHIYANKEGYQPTVDVTLIGDYTTKQLKHYNFTISPKDISSDAQIVFVDNQVDYEWCGNQVMPVVIVSDGVSHPLTKGTDYDVSYSDNINLTEGEEGSHPTVTITGKGNYTGSKSISFNIVPINIESLTFNNSDNGQIKTLISNATMPEETYNGLAFEKEFIARYNSTTDGTGNKIAYDTLLTVESSKYKVSYTDNVNAGTATVTVSFDIGENSDPHFEGSKNFTFKINPRDISSGKVLTINGIQETYPWQISAIEPKPTTVKDGATMTLDEGETKDYTVSWSNNTNVGVGTARVIVTGHNNYTGSVEIPFSIRKITFDDIKIYTKIGTSTTLATGESNNYLQDFTYNGQVIEPQVELVLNNQRVLTAGTHYKVNYPNSNIDATEGQTAEITIELIDEYHTDVLAKKVCYFKIKPRDISNVTITSLQESYPYLYAEITPTFKVTDFSGAKTLGTADYENVVISNNVEVGTGLISIDGKGNYTGTATGEFTIRKLSFNDLDVKYNVSGTTYKKTIKEGDIDYLDHFTYTGQPIEPAIIVVSHLANNNFEISKDNATGGDFEVKFSDNHTNVADDAYVTIKLKGAHCEGEKTFKIDIQPKNITDATFNMEEPTNGGYKYNGRPIKPVPTDTTVKADDITLTSSDYTISYTNNIEVPDLGATVEQKPTITLTGVGNFCGSVSKTFDILPITISVSQEVDGDILISSDNQYYINNLKGNNLSEIKLTINGNTSSYVNTAEKQNIVSVDSTHVVIPYSNFVDINKVLDKDSTCIGVKLTVYTPSETTGPNYESSKEFNNIKTTRGIERLNLDEILPVDFNDTSDSIYLDGIKLNVNDSGHNQAIIYDGQQRVVQTYTYNGSIETLGNRHKQYSDGMRVYTIDQDTTGHAKLNELTSYSNAFEYDGTAIRLKDPKGIRFFTTLTKAKRNELVNGANGYKLVEMGSVIGFEKVLNGEEPHLVQNSDGSFSGASGKKIGKAQQPLYSEYYSEDSTTLLYSTVFKLDTNIGDGITIGISDDFAVRSYMVLRPVGLTDASKDIVIYTGSLYRCISSVAEQVLPTYIGTSSESYIRSLIPPQ